MPRTEPAAAMRADEHFAQRLLLRAGAGNPGERNLDATDGRDASGISGVWQPAPDGLVAARGPTGESQTGEATAGADGSGSHVSQAQSEPARGGAPDISLPAGRAGNQWSGPGCSDITYVPMAYGFMYLVAVMDWWSRYVLA